MEIRNPLIASILELLNCLKKNCYRRKSKRNYLK